MRIYDLFISYNWQEADTVEGLARALQTHQVSPFLDRWHIRAGLSWRERLEELISGCGAVVVCIGPPSEAQVTMLPRASCSFD